MKPKLNVLGNIECDTPLFADFPSVLITVLDAKTEVFDATIFCEKESIELPDYSAFHNQCLRYINPIVEANKISTADLYYKTGDGHLLINTSILITFMQYAIPDICVYFSQIIGTLLLNGIAFSDSFVMRMAMSQLPDEAFKQIMDVRHEQESKK